MPRWAKRIAVAGVGLTLVATAAMAGGFYWVAGRVAYPPWYEYRTPDQGLRPFGNDDFGANILQLHADPRQDLGYRFESVEFPAEDGSTLRGWWVPGTSGARAGVVTVHGGGGDRREFLRHLPVFHEAGYPVLLFDCREQGISDGTGRGISLGLREHRDVSSAVAFVRARSLERVAVVGTSQGGASVILAAARDPSIDAVVAENPFTSIPELVRDGMARFVEDPSPTVAGWIGRLALWRLGGDESPTPLDVIDQVAPRPLLILHGESDQVIPFEHSKRLYARAGAGAELWIAPGSDHVQLYNDHPDEWRRRVLGLLARGIGPPGGDDGTSVGR